MSNKPFKVNQPNPDDVDVNDLLDYILGDTDENPLDKLPPKKN